MASRIFNLICQRPFESVMSGSSLIGSGSGFILTFDESRLQKDILVRTGHITFGTIIGLFLGPIVAIFSPVIVPAIIVSAIDNYVQRK